MFLKKSMRKIINCADDWTCLVHRVLQVHVFYKKVLIKVEIWVKMIDEKFNDKWMNKEVIGVRRKNEEKGSKFLNFYYRKKKVLTIILLIHTILFSYKYFIQKPTLLYYWTLQVYKPVFI